ncbi:MAG: hypothetical protein M1814_005308 [Vezdaea aestivalis]|nr:MAG: hypothetical protein M1814_005308 [Vezdaea aestivalis]
MTGGPSIARHSTQEKSNIELTTSLKTNLLGAQDDVRALQHKKCDGVSNGKEINGSKGVNGSTNGVLSKSKPKKLRLDSWTKRDSTSDTWFIPDLSLAAQPLEEEPESYNITVKLFFLPSLTSKSRATATTDALALVQQELKVSSVDLLILSFPAISFDDDDEEPVVDCYGLRVVNGAASSAAIPESMERIIAAWRILESLVDQGLVKSIGVAEFGLLRLQELMSQARIKPVVNQINLRDCCSVPKGLIKYTKSVGVTLLTHNDCTDILPAGTMRELLGPSEGGAGVLAARNADGSEEGEGLRGEITPQWVVKYTAVVENRGVVENKGYFASADLHEP